MAFNLSTTRDGNAAPTVITAAAWQPPQRVMIFSDGFRISGEPRLISEHAA